MSSRARTMYGGRGPLRAWLVTLSGHAAIACAAVALAAEPLPPEITAEAIDAAHTAEQHEAIAKAYAREAADAHAAATEHRNMSNPPGGSTYLMRPGADDRRLNAEPTVLLYHCRNLAESLERAGREADALAQAHHMMAERANGATPNAPDK